MDLDLDDEFETGVCDEGMVRCVFSTVGLEEDTGVTTREYAEKRYWFIDEVGNGLFSVRRINASHVPTGEPTIIPLDELMEKYVPEIPYYEEKTIPAMNQLEDYLDDGDQHRQAGKLYSAANLYKKALCLDEQNVRALFSLGLIYLDQQDVAKARALVGDILNIKSAFEGKNQYLFNELGISLRKSGLFDEAVNYYTHALRYVDQDENLYYNIARANYEKSDWAACIHAIERIFEINPHLDAAHELVSIVLTLSDNPGLRDRNNKASIPDSIVQQINELFTERPDSGLLRSKVPSDIIRFNYSGRANEVPVPGHADDSSEKPRPEAD